MPKDTVQNAIRVAKIATGESEKDAEKEGRKDKA